MKKKKKVEYLTPMMYRLQIIKEQLPEEYDKLMKLMKSPKQNLNISDVIKSLPSATILAEKFAESKREHVVKCRIEKGSIANLGLYLGFIEGYNYVIEELKRGNVL